MNSTDPYLDLWRGGYALAELWGEPGATSERVTSEIEAALVPHNAILALIDRDAMGVVGSAFLRDRLVTGDWIAIGYEAPRTLKSRLTILPSCIFDGSEFGADSIYANGLTFVGIRIVHTKFYDRYRAQNIDPKPGRPPSAPAIENAYRRLLAQGVINPTDEITRRVKAVQELLARERGTPVAQLKGFGREAVRRAIRNIEASVLHKL